MQFAVQTIWQFISNSSWPIDHTIAIKYSNLNFLLRIFIFCVSFNCWCEKVYFLSGADLSLHLFLSELEMRSNVLLFENHCEKFDIEVWLQLIGRGGIAISSQLSKGWRRGIGGIVISSLGRTLTCSKVSGQNTFVIANIGNIFKSDLGIIIIISVYWHI